MGCACRYFSDITLYGLEVLQLVTLSPLPRRAIIAAGGSSSSGGGRGGQAGSSRSGMATLLHAASTGNAQPFYGLADPEVGQRSSDTSAAAVHAAVVVNAVSLECTLDDICKVESGLLLNRLAHPVSFWEWCRAHGL